jgi:hypothetical protein
MSLAPLSRARPAGVMAVGVWLQRTNTRRGSGRGGGVVFIWIGAMRTTPPSHDICPPVGFSFLCNWIGTLGDTQPAKIWAHFSPLQGLAVM